MKKILMIVVLVAIVWFGYSKFFNSKNQKVQYQTAQTQRGTLVVSVTGSGQVSTVNNGTISTLATGVVSKLYVKDGDEVKAGDKIAEVDLDLQGQQNAQQSLSSYQTAKNNVETAKANMYSTQSTMFTNWKTFMDLATNSVYQNGDGTPNDANRSAAQFHVAQDDWLAGEAKYKNQQAVVSQTQTALSAAWSSYQQTSPTIYAPISGTVAGFSLQIGSVIIASQNSNNSAQSATKIASVKTKAFLTVSINLTEIDVPKVKIDDKATVTFDALPDKTFTGRIVSIDTAGVVNSGVTAYPTVIRLDSESNSILPNMAGTANIITNTKDNVLLVPSSSVQTQNGTSTVQVMKNGKPQSVTVETGLSSDTQVEIISGLSEGDTVITATIQSTTSTQTGSQSASPFGGFGGGGFRLGGGGGGARHD